jgi:hypothetical protein
MRRKFRKRSPRLMLSYLHPISSDATCPHDIQNSTWYQRYIGLPGPSYPSFPISALFAIISITAVFPLRSFYLWPQLKYKKCLS